MQFDDTFTLEDMTAEEVWLALSDPAMIKRALPGCAFLVEVSDDDPDFDGLAASASESDPPILPEADPETVTERAFVEGGRYAARMEVSIGSVNPQFDTIVTIERREFPEMEAAGEGESGNSSFEMISRMTLVETDEGVDVNWEAETDMFGRIAQVGQRMVSPVANRVINQFFKRVEAQLSEVDEESSGLRDRIRGMVSNS